MFLPIPNGICGDLSNFREIFHSDFVVEYFQQRFKREAMLLDEH